MQEFWDLYDGNRHPLSETHLRGLPMKAGTYHVVVEIWTVNNNGKILLTLRDRNKETYPDKWECTGGSILAGETSMEGAVRELFEETGIRATPQELTPLETIKKSEAFYDSYILKRDIGISALTMQEGETAAAKWVTIDELHKMIENGDLAKPISERFLKVEEKIKKYL